MCQAHSQPELLHLPATVGNHKPRIRSGLCPKPLSRREPDTGKPETSGTRRSVEESIQSVSRKHPKPTRIGACRCHLAPSRAAERPDEASDRTRTGRNGRNGAHSENARSYPITVGKRKGTHEPPFPKNDAPEENDGTKRRYTQAAPFGPGGPKAVPSTKTATKNEKNRKSSRRTCRQQARKDPKTVLSDKPAMEKPAAAGRNGSATDDSPYENGHKTGRSCAPHIGGTGGSRTLVQTRNPRAFYTLILRLILLPRPGRRRPSRSRSL